MTPVSGGPFRTSEQKAVFAALLEKIGAGPAALYTDACVLRARPDMLIATAPFVAHTLREVERAIAGRIVPVPLQKCATCGRERRDTAAQMTAIASLGVLPDIELLKKLRGEANELAHRAGLQRPRSFDADFTADVARFDEALAAVLASLAVPAATSAAAEFLERLTTPPATLDIRPSDLEREVLDSLLNKAAPGPAAWYADALALQDDRFSFLFARANLIAHALREAESALRDVLLPRGFDPIKCKECNETINGHQQEIAAILHAFEIPSEDEVARLWGQFAGPTATDGLAGLAHKSSLDLPKSFDEATAEVFRNVTEIFATLFARFEYSFGRYIHLLDELLAAKQLRKKHELAAFKGSVPHTDLTYDYFFTRATNPQWLVALRDHDAFQLTPEPYRRDGEVVFPAWPQGVYLRRLLETPSVAGDAIYPVFERATASANPRVHERIVEAALLMDSERRQKIAERERLWLEGGRYVPFLLGEAFGELVVTLAADGATQLAFAMLERLLRIEAIETGDEKDLRLYVDRLAYDHLLEKVIPSIAPACGTAILSVLADALDTVRKFEKPTLTVPPVDYSYIRRPAIEPHERNLRGGLREAIIDSLRDAAEEIVRAESDKLQVVVIWLEAREWNIYRRLALHLVAESSNSDLAADLASRPEYLGQLDLRHEMSRLIRAHAGRLRDDIPEELLTIRRTLAGEKTPLGGVEAFWAQEHSPLSSDEAEAMSVASLVEFIRTWTPAPREFLSGQTHGAFAGVIRSVVTRRASEFSSAAMLFWGLRPAYIRNLLEGLDEVLQRGEDIEWQPVMELGLWLADQQRVAGDHRVIDPFAEEETWRYVRRAFLDLLEHAMWREVPLVSVEHWRTAWHLIQRFALDPDVGSDDNETLIDADVGARSVTFALHSVSGKALSLLIRFPVILRQMKVSTTDVENTRQHIFNVVESHLEVAHAAVPTFTVIGHHFRDLIALDGDRARRLAAALFVRSEAGRAAWSAYLMNRVRLECGALLREQYSNAIDALDANSTEASFLEQRLAGHILTLYLSGALTLADDLVARFFAHASPALRAEALWDVSRGLGEAPPSALPALVALWEWCARALPSDELRAFQSWARSQKFDEIWVLDQLLSLAPRGTQLSSYLLVEYLEPIFDADPQRVTRVLATLVEHQTEEHEVHAARHAVLRIAKRAHDAGEPARQEGRRLANLMTARGFYDFKELT